MRILFELVAVIFLSVAICTASLAVIAAPTNIAWANQACSGMCATNDDDKSCKFERNPCPPPDDCICVTTTKISGSVCNCVHSS